MQIVIENSFIFRNKGNRRNAIIMTKKNCLVQLAKEFGPEGPTSLSPQPGAPHGSLT